MISPRSTVTGGLLALAVAAASCSGGGSVTSQANTTQVAAAVPTSAAAGTDSTTESTATSLPPQPTTTTSVAPDPPPATEPPPAPTDNDARLVAESFDSPGGGTWDPADFEAEAGGSGSVEVQVDSGWMTIDPEGSSEWARAAALESSDSDAELIVSLTSHGSGFGSAFIGLRTDGEWQDAIPYMPHRGIIVEYEFTPGTGGGLTLYELDGGTTTILATGVGPELPEGDSVWIRFQVVGESARLRIWPTGSPEPSTWSLDSPVALAVDGYLTLALRDDPGAAVSWDDLVLYADPEVLTG